MTSWVSESKPDFRCKAHPVYDAKQGLWGSWAWSSFGPVSYRQDFSLHDLLRVPKGRTVVDQRRSSHETTWDNTKETRDAHQELGHQEKLVNHL